MKQKSKNVFSAALAIALICSVAVSASAQKKKQNEVPAEPTLVTLSAAVPSLAANAETPQSQTRGGLRLTLTPDTFLAKEAWHTTQKQVPPPTKFGLVIIPQPGAIYIQRDKVPSFKVSPEHLSFHVQMDNQMPRVFRGAGIAVQFNVAGKVVNVNPAGYGDLVNVILPPRSQQEIVVRGPDIATIPSPCTVGVFFYDVVTDVDQAGNVKAKQNFEWFFSYQTQKTEKEVTIPPPEKTWVMPR